MPADLIRSYSPGLVTVIFGEVIAFGYADGSFAALEMSEDAISEEVGEDGSVVLNQNLNEVGQLTLRLLAQSPANGMLTALHNANRLKMGAGVRPLRVVDGNGFTTITAPEAWITKMPPADFGDTFQPREWVFKGNPMRFLGGGN